MADRSGQQLGNYRLLRLLGSGGFADVYLGEHVYLKRQVAVKVLHSHLAQQKFPSFLQEAQMIARLNHPNIVSVSDFGIDGTPFLVMEYLPHGSLRDRHPPGTPVPLHTLVSYVKQVADALQYAHDAKVIHRDVKPGNMLIGRSNEILLSDFGIATVAHSTQSLNTQDKPGTPYYYAPEQIRGKPRPASDQYALGIVVYEWLTGTWPFVGSSAVEIALKHVQEPPPPLREKVPTIPIAVEQVVLKALAKDPHQRFISVQAFAEALEQASQAEQATLVATQAEKKEEKQPEPLPTLPAPSIAPEQNIPATVIGSPERSVASPPPPASPFLEPTVPASPPQSTMPNLSHTPSSNGSNTSSSAQKPSFFNKKVPAISPVVILFSSFVAFLVYKFLVNNVGTSPSITGWIAVVCVLLIAVTVFMYPWRKN